MQVVQPPASIRRVATREVKARGVDYILIWDTDHGSEDIRDDPEGWGLSLVRFAHGARLYRIEP